MLSFLVCLAQLSCCRVVLAICTVNNNVLFSFGAQLTGFPVCDSAKAGGVIVVIVASVIL